MIAGIFSWFTSCFLFPYIMCLSKFSSFGKLQPCRHVINLKYGTLSETLSKRKIALSFH